MELGNRWSLRGETALVTGGSKGIGCAIVEELARFGAAVHTCARNEAELKQSLQKWRDLKLQVTGSVCDVSSSEEREKLIEEVSAIFNGKLNILVNNAASAYVKPVLEVTQEEYKHIMNTNLEAGFHLSQLAHPLLKASGRGNIIFISSIASLEGTSFMSVYGASKGAMNQLTRCLACEWAKDNIRTNCVVPGAINTPMAKPIAQWSSGQIDRAVKTVEQADRPSGSERPGGQIDQAGKSTEWAEWQIRLSRKRRKAVDRAE
ncbi:hypothetical protein ZIOFF_013029 [Zingiber officinale]|uniref:Uncharacterized protein n=1 Tax=Zingiber officinale TaxID=94328 RepID=A0A8J5H864_ZINOF|nr:hypothetical protein ZIOFF_013029 [Zingiber officinale]